MTSRILKSTDIPELQPTVELDHMTKGAARHRFTAGTTDEAQAWQKECRAALGEALGFLGTPAVDPEPEVIEEVDRGDLVRTKIVISTAPHTRMPVYLLAPKGAQGNLPVMLAYAGHGYGVKDIVGLWEDGGERTTPEDYHFDFALSLARKGFLVAAPEISCFGERQTDYSQLKGVAPSTCHNAATWAMMLGKSVVGMRVRDSMRLVDFLSTLPNTNTERLGAMGISGGGLLTFFHTAMDPRVKACVVSGYFSSFRDSILAMSHCTCNFVPGLLNIGEMEDIVGLITPRPTLIEGGDHDPIFPIETVRRSVARAKQICAILGGDPERDFELDEFEGRHRINGRRSFDFLWERLGVD